MMEFLLDGAMYLLVSFLDKVIPVFKLPPGFIAQLDSMIAFIIDLINSAGYFVPLSVLGMCMTVIIAVDTFTLTVRLVLWVIGVIRG